MFYQTTSVAVLATWLMCVVAQTGCGGDSTVGSDLAQPTSTDLAMNGDVDLGGTTSDGASPGGNPYGAPGPEMSSTSTQSASLAGADVTLTIVMPVTAGPRPLVVISPGFGQPAAGYVPYAQRLASFGVIAILRDDPGAFTSSTTAAAQLVALVGTWLPSENAKATGTLAGRVDLAKVGLMGHSRGGQVSLLAADGDLKGKVAAYFGLDPVDTGMGGPQARTGLPGIGIPTAFMGETLDGTPVFLGMACAPAADNYQVLYAAAPSPSLLLTVNGADHFDFELGSAAVGAAFCHAGTADGAAVLDMAVALATGFFARELLGQTVGATLDGAGAAGYVMSGLLTRSQK